MIPRFFQLLFIAAFCLLTMAMAQGTSEPDMAEISLPAEADETPLAEDSDAATTETEGLPETLLDEESAITEPPDEAQSASPQVDIHLGGRKTWTVRYGFGSPVALAPYGIQPGSLSLDQTLTVDVRGEVFSILRIEAQYNDQLPDMMQSIAIYLDTEQLSGVLGDFTFSPVPGFTTYLRTMKGLMLEYRMGDATLTAFASRAQGTPESKVFVGQTARSTVSYSYWLDEEDGIPAPYRQNLDGLAAYPLRTLYAEEFSSLNFQFVATPQLRNVFTNFEVAYLFDALAEGPEWELKTQDYRILEPEDQVLLLRRDPMIIVRDRIRDLISLYNKRFNLTGDQAKEYPFVLGTDYEMAFLADVAAHAQIVVDEVIYPILSAERRRFYSLGYSDVRAGNAVVEVSTDGRRFEQITLFGSPDFRVTFYEEAGILACDFPSSFYTPSSVVRVTFDYRATDGAFMLGLSVIPGSVRVTLNADVLREEEDYVIDYELGALFLLVELGNEDVLRVDYERYAGGFGYASDYARYFYGMSLDLPVSDRFSLRANLLQLADVAFATSNPESIDAMPNRHTVAGAEARISLEDLSATVLVGYNHDVFPFDDNARTPTRNVVSAIASGEGYVLIGHRQGLTVYDEGDWSQYGMHSGLSGHVVHAIVLHQGVAYLGTSTGLTMVRLDGTSPFDRSVNYSRHFVMEELPSSVISSILVLDGFLWIGTKDGLVQMPMDDHASWKRLAGPQYDALPPITAMEAHDGHIYLGTEQGLYSFSIDTGSLDLLRGTEGDDVHDLTVHQGSLVVASNRGLRGFHEGRSTGWLVFGQPVYASVSHAGRLFYGTADGLSVIEDVEHSLPQGAAVTALGCGPEGVWAAGQWPDDGAIDVWLIASRVHRFAGSVTGIPRDDPRAYVDIPASEHTVTGWTTRASFQHHAEGYAIAGNLEWRPQDFRAIGSTSRSDTTGWGVDAQFDVGTVGRLEASHDYRLSGQLTNAPVHRMSNSLSLSWASSWGPQWTASLSHSDDGTGGVGETQRDRQLTTSVSVQDKFFRDSLSLRLQWNLLNTSFSRTAVDWQRETVSLSYDWRLLEDMSLSGSWSRPVQRADDRLAGTERLQGTWAWRPSVAVGGQSLAQVDARYTIDWRRTLFEPLGQWVHRAALRLDFPKMDLADWSVDPSLRAEGTHDGASSNLLAEAVSQWKNDDLTARATVRGQLSELGRPVFHRIVDWSLNLRHAGFAQLDPSLTYTGSRRTAVRGNETSLTGTDTVTGRLVWTPREKARNDLSLSVRLRTTGTGTQITGTLNNRLTMDLVPVIEAWMEEESGGLGTAADLRLESKAEYRMTGDDPDITFSTTADVQISWPPNWSVSLGTTYSAGLKKATGFYHGVMFAITFAISF